MKYVLVLLLTLFGMSQSFADELTNGPNEQLEEIIDLFLDESREGALTQLELHESDLIALVRESKDAEAHKLLGRAYFYAEMDTKAIDAFKSALELDPSLSGAHFFVGILHRYADDLDGAVESFRGAIAANSDDEKYFLELARTLEMKGDRTSASTAYKNALALNKDIFDANFNLATIYANEGDADSAEKHYLAAIEQEPNDLDTHYNLGQLYQNIKQHNLAIKRFEKVVELEPNDWRAISKLVQENEAVSDYAARDSAVENIYEVWRTNENEELREQGFYIREQSELENGKLFVLEYFELKGDRARKFVFKLRDAKTGDGKFEISLGSYDGTTEFSRAKGTIGPDERIYHLDGYGLDGSHYTYGFFDSVPAYDLVKEMALKVLADEQKIISSTIPSNETAN